MQNRQWLILLLFLGISSVLLPRMAYADIVYPSRLELIETQPGTLDITFVLPVIQGKVLKARPLLPPSFMQINEPITDGDYNTKTVSWRVSFDPDSLAGSEIAIEGLSGSQIDLLLDIQLLSGRQYQTTLSPVRSIFVIPGPAHPLQLLGTAMLQGMRRLLIYGPLYLLLFLLSMRVSGYQNWAVTALSFVLAHAAGLFAHLLFMELIMASRSAMVLPWLPLPEYLPAVAALGMSLIVSVRITGNQAVEIGNYAIFLALLLGFTYGLAGPDMSIPAGLSHSEANWFTGMLNVGVLVGGMLMLALVALGRDILLLFIYKNNELHQNIFFGQIAGIIALGWLIFTISRFGFNPSLFPSIPIELIYFAVICGIWMVRVPLKNILIAVFGLTFLAGLFIVGVAISAEISFALIMSVALLMLITTAFNVTPGVLLSAGLLILAGIGAGYHLAQYSFEVLSYPVVQTAGNSLVLAFLLLFIYQLTVQTIGERRPTNRYRTTFLSLLGLAGVLILIAQYLDGLFPEVQNLLALGSIWLPVVSIGLVVAAAATWPLQRRIHKAMALKRRHPVLSSVLLVLSITLLPIGFTTSNPWYRADVPDSQEAARILENLLTRTYTSFNTPDPDLLFTKLSETVSNRLIDDLYLDSRRRLSSGLREGSEVAVENVDVLKTSPAVQSTLQSGSYSIPAEWMVTARVRHLQHVHFRQNRYVGNITINHENDQWKISDIALKSEDRKVIMVSQR